MVASPSMRDKREKDYDWLVGLTQYEEQAVSLLRPVDLATASVALTACTSGNGLLPLWNYFRVVISSSAQTSRGRKGLSTKWLVYDQVSGGVLGAISTAGADGLPRIAADKYLSGGKIAGAYTQDTAGGDRIGYRTAIHIQSLLRCLPVLGGSDLLLGKLMLYLTVCREISDFEQAKTGAVPVLYIAKTLHGKASMYSRVPYWEYLGTGEDGKGVYCAALRKNTGKILREQTSSPGKYLCPPSVVSAVEEWRERWLIPRTERGGMSTVFTPDVDTHRLSLCIKEKRELLRLDVYGNE